MVVTNLMTVGKSSVVYKNTVVNEASESPLPNTAITMRNVQYSKPIHTERPEKIT